MEPTITHYLIDNVLSFEDAPFNDVDALVLSTVSYFYLEYGSQQNLVKDSLVQLPLALAGIPQRKLFGNLWLNDFPTDKFLLALFESPRYYNVKVGLYQSEFSHEMQSQFAAMTFVLPDDTVFIAYRGTDSSLDGWREDFNLSYMFNVPSQVLAQKYLEFVAEKMDGNLILGGHSKGGNLAEYAALMTDETIFDRIVNVYSFDGPGFETSPCLRFFSDGYNERLVKIIPESSLIGLLMENRDSYKVVRANSIAVLQHASVNWAVYGTSFAFIDKVNLDAKILADSINSWLNSYSPSERERLVDILYKVLDSAGVTQLNHPEAGLLDTVSKVLFNLNELDPQLKSEVSEMLGNVVRVYRKQAGSFLNENRKKIIPEIVDGARALVPSFIRNDALTQIEDPTTHENE